MGYSHTSSQGVTYYLHQTEVTLRGGRPRTIHFFAKVAKNAKGQPIDLPSGLAVEENPRNGFLTVSKKDKRRPAVEDFDAVSGITIGDYLEEATDEVGLVEDTQGRSFLLEVVRPLYASSYSLEVAELRRLVEGGVHKADLQEHLANNPELMPWDTFEVRPQVVLYLPGGGTLRPDFMLRPVDGVWDILELKLPSVPLIILRERHPYMSAEMTKAIAQLRSYADALEQDDVRRTLVEMYGIETIKPKLRLIMGRSVDLDRQRLRQVTSSARGIDLYTWDDVIDIAEHRGRRN